MQTDHQNTTGITAQLQARIFRTEQVHQFVVDDFDDLLSWLDALNDFLPDGLYPDAFDKVAGHLEIHIGFQKRQAHFAKRLTDIVFRDLAQPAQITKRVLKFAA